MNKFKIEELDNFSTGKNINCYCNKCEKNINHTVVKSIKKTFEEISYDYGVDGFTDYQTIKCNCCGEYSFREYKYFSEYMDMDADGTWEVLYPMSNEHNRILLEMDNLPFNLDLIYDETIKCFNQRSYVLCATGIRAIIEGICLDQKVTSGTIEQTELDGSVKQKQSRNLYGRINGLHNKGCITKQNSDSLHELRFLGNKAVHELESPSKSDLILALDIIEHLLIDIYELPYKANKLRSKRKSSK